MPDPRHFHRADSGSDTRAVNRWGLTFDEVAMGERQDAQTEMEALARKTRLDNAPRNELGLLPWVLGGIGSFLFWSLTRERKRR